ncbi:MAG: glycosyltransferase family 4 protein [Desulfobulbaceae bacterium]|nr:glycosyltransferase family 4 protein [Desulfobulbaceae bacterium]
MPEDTRQPLGKKLKIAVLVRNFVITGGAERYAYQVSRRLAREHEVHIFCQTWDEELTPGFTIHRIPRPLRKPTFVNQLLFSWYCGRRVDNSFDLIYSHERVRRYDVLSIHCPCYRGFLTRSRGWRKLLLWLGELTSPRGLAYLWLERSQYAARPDRLMVADSRMAADDVLDNYPSLPREQIGVAYPGVDLEEIDQALAAVDREELRRQHGLAPENFVLLFVGTEFKRKGLDALLQGLSRARTKTAKLLVAGQPDDLAAYRQQAERLGLGDRVSFLGRIAAIYPLYILADTFILPTLADPCPIAPLEAMTCGTATIMSSTPWCGTAEHVKNDEAVILQNPKDAEEIARAIDRLADPVVRQVYADKGRSLGRTLGWEHTTAITLATFAKVIQAR